MTEAARTGPRIPLVRRRSVVALGAAWNAVDALAAGSNHDSGVDWTGLSQATRSRSIRSGSGENASAAG
jgi:hypothetical protein